MVKETKYALALRNWPRWLLSLPYSTRVMLCVACFMCCLVIHMVMFDATHNGGIITFAVALAVWMFKRRGLIICVATGTVVLVLFHYLRLHTFFWPLGLEFSFVSGWILLVLCGAIVLALRNMLDAAEEDREKERHAERQITIAYEQQRQLTLIKQRFLLSVNHELRTPLTSLYASLQMLEVLLEQPEIYTPEKQRKYLHNALLSCDELCSLTSTVLDTLQASSETGETVLSTLYIDCILCTTLESFQAQSKQKRTIDVQVGSPLLVTGNARYIEHVLLNLLSNACKFSPVDTPVVVTAALLPEAAEVRISVQDRGLGIPPHEIPLLFEQFLRLERDVTGTVRGTGLGLYICKHLVEAMHGRIWVESTGIVGQGSCFSFTLPAVILAPAVSRPA